MATKAKLTVVLKANETVVAESDDPGLWQQVLAAIQGGGLPAAIKSEVVPLEEFVPSGGGNKSIENFARGLGIQSGILIGAISPSRDAPYLHLDRHCWAQMKKEVPQRGPGSISATGLAGTLLALWFKEAKMDMQATQALAAAVLNTIDFTDKNTSRGIKNTKWLQGRAGGAIVINPAEIVKAQAIARAFCTKQWSEAIRS
ncbi:MAG TPA: hypothetical protein VNW15_05820 [Rhizomicrobium sp.]|jgi:hypothetical protein|nr:hypothetical protein [Rhizomicrobium sp.]